MRVSVINILGLPCERYWARCYKGSRSSIALQSIVVKNAASTVRRA